MKPVYQTKFGGSSDPPEEQGNCLAACLASIFELTLDEVPDFGEHLDNGTWFTILQQWLSKRNLYMFTWTLESGYPLGIHMLATKSTYLANPDDGHLVVIDNGRIVHNPNKLAASEGEPEQFWVFAVLDPSKQVLVD